MSLRAVAVVAAVVVMLGTALPALANVPPASGFPNIGYLGLGYDMFAGA